MFVHAAHPAQGDVCVHIAASTVSMVTVLIGKPSCPCCILLGTTGLAAVSNELCCTIFITRFASQKAHCTRTGC